MSKEKYYEQFWDSRNTIWPSRYQPAFEMIEENSRVLDIGCGNGAFGKRLIELKNCKVYGTDLSHKAVERANKNGIKAVYLDVEKQWPFKRKEFDYIVALELLEHLFYPERFLEKASNSAKHVVASYGNTNWWRNRLAILLGKVPAISPFKNGTHLWYWNYYTFKELIEKRFQIEEERLLATLPIVGRFLPDATNERIIRNFFPNVFTYAICVKAKPKAQKAAE